MNSHLAPILLVEDNRADVLLIQRAMRIANISTPLKVVGDGQAAIDYLLGNAPYHDRTLAPLPIVILLDLKLPGASGLEVLRWLKQQGGLKRLPVVVLTTSREILDLRQSYDLGVNSYLVKPIKSEALVQMLQMVYDYWVKLNEPPDLGAP